MSRQHLKKLLKSLKPFFRAIAFSITQHGLRATLNFYSKLLRITVRDFLARSQGVYGIESHKNNGLRKLQIRTEGLHSLLDDKGYSYSIIIPVYHPEPEHFRVAIESVLNQTAPDFEVLIGFDGYHEESFTNLLQQMMRDHPNGMKLKHFTFLRTDSQIGGISETTNKLVSMSLKKYILLMDHDDWIRPDLLYRYELMLRSECTSRKIVLYCNEYKIDGHGNEIAESFLYKKSNGEFPYLFINSICHCLLLRKDLWQEVGGLRAECDGAQDYDLCLRLDSIGAVFLGIPVYLYAWRAHAGSTASSLGNKDYATNAGILSLKHYCAVKGYDWHISVGKLPTTYRATPVLLAVPKIHVIIPFHENKKMTLKCINKVSKSIGVKVFVTVIDNRSTDLSIAQEIAMLGHEVLHVDEPFNYSRINNFAFQKTKYIEKDHVIFLNNDVYLECGALEEMARWSQLSDIGAVGCKLNYPDGHTQHAGILLDESYPAEIMGYSNIGETHSAHMHSYYKDVIGLRDAVTGACLMMKPKLFQELGGFDEVYYPISFSDVDLCIRIKEKNLKILYSPYAQGIHFESKTRGRTRFEELELSRFLHNRVGELRALKVRS